MLCIYLYNYNQESIKSIIYTQKHVQLALTQYRVVFGTVVNDNKSGNRLLKKVVVNGK